MAQYKKERNVWLLASKIIIQDEMKNFLLESKNPQKDGVMWYMVGSFLMAFQSVILLMILTRTVGLVQSGIFTIAYANANLFLNIGKYGMRNYQVSDVKNEFNFNEYLNSRWITTFLMIGVACAYTCFAAYSNQYSLEKTSIIIWMCLFKAIDAIEDVFIGEYQKKGKLYVGAKILTLRMILSTIVFLGLVLITKKLLITLIISTIFSAGLEWYFINRTYPTFKEECESVNSHVILLLKNCFPVALGTFLSFYITNAPKYAIDAHLSDEMQACYGFISMPVFVIALLNGVVFTPFVYNLSCLWNENEMGKFILKVVKQTLIVAGITTVCLIAVYICGIPILSILYNTDLSDYKLELLILMLGGGFSALSGMLNTVITIMRKQNALLINYMIVSATALILANSIVRQYQMMGAAILYTALMGMLSVGFIVSFMYGIKKKKEHIKE